MVRGRRQRQPNRDRRQTGRQGWAPGEQQFAEFLDAGRGAEQRPSVGGPILEQQ